MCGNYRKKIDLPLREIISVGLFVCTYTSEYLSYTNYIDKITHDFSRIHTHMYIYIYSCNKESRKLKKISGFIYYRYIHNARLDSILRHDVPGKSIISSMNYNRVFSTRRVPSTSIGSTVARGESCRRVE